MNKFLSIVGLIAVFYIFLGQTEVKAQVSDNEVTWTDTSFVEYNRWYVGGMFGVYQFYGDLAKKTYFPGSGKKGEFNWMFGLNGGREFNQYFGARADFNMGKMYSEEGGDWFEASTRDISLSFTMNVTNLVAPYIYNKKWNATVFIGAGFFGYRSIAYDANDNVIGNVGYDINGDKESLEWNSTINLGVDIAYKITKSLDVFLEVGLINTPVDDLDAKFVVLSELDNYSRVALGVHYTFGKEEQAYKWNPKPDHIRVMEKRMVDMGNAVEEAKQCCEANMINPCDTSTVDGDKDLVPDCRDLELDSPKGSIVNFQGIAIISPDSTGQNVIAAGVGTPKRSNFAAPMIFFSPVYFEYDKTVIDSTGEYNIINVAIYMKQYPDSRILISGNTDKHGSGEYNEGLSERRCKKLFKILTEEYGIEPNRLEMQPNGKRMILFPKKDHANRRVDFSVIQ